MGEVCRNARDLAQGNGHSGTCRALWAGEVPDQIADLAQKATGRTGDLLQKRAKMRKVLPILGGPLTKRADNAKGPAIFEGTFSKKG